MISEERLRQAAEKAGEALADSLPAPESCREAGSLAFQARMERLLRRARWKRWGKRLQWAAVLALVLLALPLTVFSQRAQAETWVQGWVREDKGDYQDYYHNGYTDLGKVVAYTIDLPEGYTSEMVYIDRKSLSGMISYESTEELWIDFGWFYETEYSGSAPSLGASKEYMKEAAVHGVPADLYLPQHEGGDHMIVWSDPESEALLYLWGFVEEAELIQLAESVRPVRVPLYDIDLPEGYVLQERTSEEAAETERYQNDQGQWLVFRRETLAWHDGVGAEQRIDRGAGKEVMVRGLPAELYSSWQKGNACQTIAWNDPLTGVRLTLTAPMEEEALIRLAESVTEK